MGDAGARALRAVLPNKPLVIVVGKGLLTLVDKTRKVYTDPLVGSEGIMLLCSWCVTLGKVFNGELKGSHIILCTQGGTHTNANKLY